jgi:hypothetical protein
MFAWKRTSLAKLAMIESVFQTRDSHGEHTHSDGELSVPKRQNFLCRWWKDERSPNLSTDYQTEALTTMLTILDFRF